ncbi:MAG: hypothetical protein A2X35_02145 [Elusimicrobia bacterium GWA2_61_42]|nr:MAG: hypothetical protein A2X35_02145 [Elusimicrobia bacterium GWA2_61_42]OGR79856.1 MAG: hypothetical protein A2X38_12160 [Elusimicrobia bacterium GWC2_61_25]
MTNLKITILSIEDDEHLADLLGSLLDEAGYGVVHFYDANSALEWLKTNKPDLIISDIGLPGISGTQFCRLLKSDAATEDIPVMMLTSLGDELHKVESFKLGADDYVVKPFSNAELLARIEALLRRCRHGGQTDRLLVSGALVLDMDTGDVSAEGERLTLLPKEYSLLAMFLKRKGHILRFSFIEDAVWGGNAIATRDTIKVTVHRLKAKLGKYSDCIEPIIGQGYKWVEK